MKMLRTLALSFALLLITAVSLTVAADDVKDRIASFQAMFSSNMSEAVKLLAPIDDPRLVDAIATVYGHEDTKTRQDLEPLYMMADQVMLSARGDAVFARIYEQLAPKKLQRARFRFMMVLAELKHASTLPFVLKNVLAEKDEQVQHYMVKALANYYEDEAHEMLFKLAKDALTLNISRFAVNGLAQIENKRTTELLWKLVDDTKAHGAIRAEAFNMLFIRHDDNVDAKLSSAIDDKAPEVRLAAIMIAAETKRSDLASKIVASLTAPEWNVRCAAVRACEKLKIEESVGPLIELWKKETGRIEEDIHKALLVITGKSFGPDWRFWEAWFSSLDQPPKAAEKPGDYVSYHGLKTKSKNIAFVIDRSGSMLEEVKAKHDGYGGEGVKAKDGTKLAMVQAELIRVIKSLPEDTLFNIVAFESTVVSWKDMQVKADKKTKEDAIKWVEKLTANGQTNIYDALVEAFGRITKGGKVNTEYKTGPDTIFLLSDGLPNVGTISKMPEILEAVKQMNRIRQVTIHTIGVGTMTKMFLEPLAQQNGGTFKLIAE